MAEWINNKPACLKTWIHLKALEQHNEVFTAAGLLKMNQLLFWNQSAGSGLRELSAKTICTQLDNMFRLFDKAEYENSSNTLKAIDGLVKVMTDESKTIADLAAAADINYRFRGEV
jgi:ubiquinone biosynthesis protein UbiJ